MTMTALIVDDSRIIRALASQILEDEGFTCLEAADGSQALEMLRKQPDIIVTDLNMPRMSGVSLTRAVRMDPRGKDIPLVMMSGENDDSLRREALEAGVDRWVDKPFDPRDLLKAVGNAMLLRSSPYARRPAAQVIDSAANW